MGERLIHILPEQVASQIAAGEVVERPASAVKELMENSLDAGAGAITVEIEAGGTALLAVADNGCGMGPHDALLSIRRHATSKIRSAADLIAIGTLGFRGEALAAIASVSRLTLKTRQAHEPAGVELSVAGDGQTQQRECAMAPGTRIEARELFFNTPARLKFLKSPAAEQSAVVEVVQRLALTVPKVAFELWVDGRRLLDLAPAVSVLERYRQVFGAKVAGYLLPISAGGDGVAVSGLISTSQESFPTSRMLHTYVNGRSVRDRLIQRAIANAYATLLPKGRYPAVALMVTVRAQDVDVNVHPMKAEVRFRRPGVVFETVYRSLRVRLADQAVVTPDAAPAIETPAPFQAPAQAQVAAPARASNGGALRLVMDTPPSAGMQPALNLGYGRLLPAASDQCERLQTAVPAPRETAAPIYSKLRILGQLFAGYIALEGAEGLLLVDQHAAHERITFERLKAQLNEGGVQVQAHLTAEVLELNPARAAQVEAALPRLRALGFDLEPFGPASLLLKGTPAVFGAEGGIRLLADMLDSLGEGEADGALGFENLLKQLACHGSVRVGRILKLAEIEALLADLDRTPFNTNCPHGRPVHIQFPRTQIERLFRR